LQYSNAGGEAWEIWSHVVRSGRQRVDTQGAVPNKIFLKPFLVMFVQGLERVNSQGAVPDGFTLTSPWYCEPLLDITAHGQIPRPSPSVFAYYKKSKLEVGMALE